MPTSRRSAYRRPRRGVLDIAIEAGGSRPPTRSQPNSTASSSSPPCRDWSDAALRKGDELDIDEVAKASRTAAPLRDGFSPTSALIMMWLRIAVAPWPMQSRADCVLAPARPARDSPSGSDALPHIEAVGTRPVGSTCPRRSWCRDECVLRQAGPEGGCRHRPDCAASGALGASAISRWPYSRRSSQPAVGKPRVVEDRVIRRHQKSPSIRSPPRDRLFGGRNHRHGRRRGDG